MKIRIDSKNSGKTIRSLLRGDLGFSSAMLKKLKFSEEGILVNSEFKTVRYELQEGDILYLALEDTEDDVSPYIIPVDIPLEIVYSDENLYVINKPPNMPAHPSFGHRNDTVANALAFLNYPNPYVFRPVNRLDRDTSGAMLVARSRLAAYTLYRSMINGAISKSYIAVLDGCLESDSGVIETNLHRCADSIVKREVCSPGEGKYSRTVYNVILKNGTNTLVRAYPETGRTHQLRVHFASIVTPICGDTMYGRESPLISRQALHAHTLDFPSPADGSQIHTVAPILQDFQNLITEIFGLTPEETEAICSKN